MMSAARTLVFVAIAAVAAPQAAAAQGEQGRITGKVTDGSGGALPGVTVTIGSPRLARPVTVITDGVGQFLSPALPPDTYSITFELSGFEGRTNPAFELKPGDIVVVNPQMGLASLVETVEVVAAAPPPPRPRRRLSCPHVRGRNRCRRSCSPRSAAPASRRDRTWRSAAWSATATTRSVSSSATAMRS